MTIEEAKRTFEDLRGHKIILSDLSVNEQQELCDIAISVLSENKGEDSEINDVLDRISAEINTPNRGNCDYFIVDQIENIISEYREGVSK